MAKQTLYSIYDRGAKEYGDPIPCVNDDIARRVYILQMKKVDAVIAKDFELYSLGQFDSDTGKLYSYRPKKIDMYAEEVNAESIQ